ncbi:spermatogenesis-associated protein 5 isoform X1 [Zootermopsis nevadensis]|uniref:spermatogenesis-associated protein 5 isoform X1 n=1 Tax=Zootermopsis nevadensis TaxID=136037 RepID=UPI000B8EA906|nr:spermatogenesis-associated protein 5 isoform X1 [Zootermopsis nevadensis]
MMPPKGRKSISPWNLCENCKVIVSQKDLTTHAEDSCPPSFESWTHGFIKQKVLYGILEEVKPQDGLKNVPKSECDNLVLLAQSALQLCDVSIGDPVIVSVQGVSTVKTAWPTLEKSLVSVLMTKSAMDLHWVRSCDGHVIVKKLTEHPLPAELISVEMTEGQSIPHTDLSGLLQGKHRNRILKIGDRLCLQHYGQNLYFTVKQICPFQGATDLKDKLGMSHLGKNSPEAVHELNVELNNLKLSQDDDCGDDENLYRIVEGTKWTVGSAVKKESSQDKPSCSLASVGGLQDVIEEIHEIIQLALRSSPLVQGLPVIRGILLYGVPGTGKTMLAEAVAAESNVAIVNISGAEIYSKYLGETEGRLRQLFRTAEQQAPSIVLLDEVDALCPRRGSDGSGGSEQDKRVVTTLLTLLDGLHHSVFKAEGKKKKAVLVIATTSKPDTIDSALRRPGRFDREIEICVPSPSARLDILHKLLSRTPHKVTEDELKDVAHSAHGFVGADLASLCSRAAVRAIKRTSAGGDGLCGSDSVIVEVEDFIWAMTQVKPSAMREVLIEVPNVRWSDVGGQHELKLKLRQAVEWPLKHPEVFTRLGISPPRGVLMFGPPGCSKTMIAKALATESKLNFLSIKGPELFSKWVGESERAVREVFRKARQVAPAIVFFDELDALGGERSGSSGSGASSVQERVLAQLLTELDGVEPLGNVTVVGATNRPDRIDKALLRPGRLDRVVYVPLPDASTRQEILEMQLRKMPVASDVNIDELVGRTEGYSGAEVVAVCHEAALAALEEDLNATDVTCSHFMSALQLVTPRTPSSLLQLYEMYLKQS